ncbi:ABC transporter permease [Bacillus manliponensis]|uniref:ABC transporter permease n=1 Tax=Bacillus manliponensis TaxID=574376 RepID=UPI003513FE20
MFLALRELKQSKLRYGLIGCIMTLLSFLVLVISGLANGLSYDNASSIQNMDAKQFVLGKDSENKLLRSQLTEEEVQNVTKQIDEGKAVPFYVKMSTYEMKNSEKKVDIAIFANKEDTFLQPSIVKGRAVESASTEAVADESIQQKGVHLGDVITDPISQKEFEIVGFTEGQMFSHTPVMYVNEAVWSEIAQPNQQNYSAVAVQTEERIKNAHVVTKKEVLQSIPGYKEEQGTLTMIIVFLLVIAALLIGVFFYVITLQKTGQIGVLKAIGTTNAYLVYSLVMQACYLSIAAIVISIGLVGGLQQVLPESMPFLLTTTMIWQYASIFIVISIVGTVISLYQVLKVDALEAIGGGAL